jgi:hypothetical protein
MSVFSIAQAVCSVPNIGASIKIVLLLNAHQLLMLSAETLIYFKQKLFLSAIFYNKRDTFKFIIYSFNSTRINLIFNFSPLNYNSDLCQKSNYYLHYINCPDFVVVCVCFVRFFRFFPFFIFFTQLTL